jgi:hypothetical protein
MNQVLRRIAAQLVGMANEDLTTAERNILEILEGQNIVVRSYVGNKNEIEWKVIEQPESK